MSGVDRLGWRRKFGVIAPSTNTIVQPEFDMMRVPGVTSHYGRIFIPDGRIATDEGMENLLVQIRANMDACVESLMTMQPDYMVMGMSAETFWDGVEGNRQFVKQIQDLTGGLGVATGAEACERALKLYGAKKIGVITPYTPIGDANVRKFFTELGFEVGKIKGLCVNSAVEIAQVSEQTLREAIIEVNDDDVDAIVQCGTNLCMTELADEAERWLGKPVIAINAATWWMALRDNGIDDKLHGYGSLLRDH
ncbi:maleate cis-trans isomerase family protein [Nocardioides jishulii]|uniref:Arylmalonate decarboxylase n=1 Tax=Nocardioides jishulii TaxID=2575440 RepID=A0A4U2YR30_9ACTN|nr:arylmalonate decarboxylase [Nocardioides jishulii]QCX27614.1 arylmalonate decarboxylase [Nocardioides jishulii]TKI62421.1 arylmalonate decarboxylase [Nocardioides jishulii]